MSRPNSLLPARLRRFVPRAAGFSLLLMGLAAGRPAGALDVVRKPLPTNAVDVPATPGAPAVLDSIPRPAPPVRVLDRTGLVQPAVPLLLDPIEMAFGSAVIFSRIPTVADLNDLAYVPNVQHVVLSLPQWPAGWDELQPLAQMPLPDGADLVVILPGYPPTHAASEAWNYLRRPLRLILIVKGPPVDRGTIFDLNAMRGLERVVADMREPSRSGFERLQRPLSFRVVRP